MRKKPTQYRITCRDSLFVSDGTRAYLNLPGEFYYDMKDIAAPTPEEIRQMLLQIRRERRWPYSYMAAVFGVSQAIVRKWLSGERHPEGASRKLIWLLHDILCHVGKVNNHRDIATWGDRYLGHVILVKDGDETYALPSQAVSPSATHDELVEVIRQYPGLRNFKAFRTPQEPDPLLAEQPGHESVSGTACEAAASSPASANPGSAAASALPYAP